MSSVIVNVGQCGNQIGSKLLNYFVTQDERSAYEHEDGNVRSISVDSEPKVVNTNLNLYKLKVRKSNIVIGKGGCGNNWAVGYHGSELTKQLREQCLEAIRKEAERCPNFSGVILLHSLCGGTGSGLGSRLCSSLRDELGLAYVMNCVVAPHVLGESPLQHYNSALCLAALQENSDAITVLYNDEALRRAQKANKGSDVTIGDVNQHLASSLYGILGETKTFGSGCNLGSEPWEIVRAVCPMPTCKCLHLSSCSKTKSTWESVTSSLCHNMISVKYSENHKPYSTIAGVCVARGQDTTRFAAFRPELEKKLISAYNCVEWNPFPFDYWTGDRNVFGKHSNALTVAANHSSILGLLEHVVKRASEKFVAKAYLHWYWKHGADETEFLEAFETLSTMRESYETAVQR